MHAKDIALVFDTSNEVVACGLGSINDGKFTLLAQENLPAHRASNTKLLPTIETLCAQCNIEPSCISMVGVGRGPGSFTGVRIAMATAKGIAAALEVPLVGISTLESIAWNIWSHGYRGRLLVLADAMRKEVYPAYFQLDESGCVRLSNDRVVKAAAFAEELPQENVLIAGDALPKYQQLFADSANILPEELWTPTGNGLFLALRDCLNNGVERKTAFDVLPVYTRLSDAEETERVRLASSETPNLVTGVQKGCIPQIDVVPLPAHKVSVIAQAEQEIMGSDAWNADTFSKELSLPYRSWWVALHNGEVAGYAGVLVAGDTAEILKVGTLPAFQRKGIARRLLSRALEDARNLAADVCTLEVRASNNSAQCFYESLGMQCVSTRKGYYSDGEDALVYTGLIEDVLRSCSKYKKRSVAGISLSERREENERNIPTQLNSESQKPVILAIETSCDETAAAVIDGNEVVLSDIVASQIDFHARFGGVVPEIASRKHIEAIAGVAQAALDDAQVSWHDLDAIAATYAPGLVGALVVGVAFAKGVSWALQIPYIGVNHLEGHLYANKLACSSDNPFVPPAIVSLLSGGNTLLVYMKDWQDYVVLGSTIDDAVGEAFDKVAKALGLPYPGGPHISRLAEKGNKNAIDFPRAMMHSKDYRFSLSGLKTAVVTYIDQHKHLELFCIEDVCASFEQAVIDVQVHKASAALDETGALTLCVGGGVAANPSLRKAYAALCESKGIRCIVPPLSVCGDNAAMIALVALERYKQGKFFELNSDAYAHADLSEPY